ncbi:MAG: 4Fe-4S dicluster domain-containing protein [candidate division NC10 bacterium]|nr:4Fe-4S dicluster domain-containing protein [candidate division NC10 bacterium]
MNKREFLKGLIFFFPAGGLATILTKGARGGEAGGAVKGPEAPGNKEAKARSTGGYDPERHYYGMGIEIDKCIGCSRCVEACKAENAVPREPFFFRTWMERYLITKEGEAVVESINVKSKTARETTQDDREVLRSFFVPKLCNQCYHRVVKGLLPACVEVCPTQARIFGDLRSKASRLVRFKRMNKIHVLKPSLNTEPKVYYAQLDGEVR